MITTKSIVEGMGSASGVACSAFGILAAAQHYSLTVSPLATMVAGYISMGVFLVVGIPIAVWLYQQYHINLSKKNELIHQREDELIENILSYFWFCKLQSDFLLSNILKQQIISSLGNNDPMLHPFILDLIKDDSILVEVIRAPSLEYLNGIKQTVKDRLKNIYHQQSNSPLNRASLVMPGFMGFVTGFGCVAGSGAGLGNLFTVTGYFIGYAAAPGFAIIVLLSGVVMGAILANTYIDLVKQDETVSLEITYYEKLSAKLSSIKDRLLCLVTPNSVPKKLSRSYSADLSHDYHPYLGRNNSFDLIKHDSKLADGHENLSPSRLAFQ